MKSLDIEYHPQNGSASRYVRLGKQQNRSVFNPAPSSAARGAAFPDAVDVYLWLCQAGGRPRKRRVGMVGPAGRRMVFSAPRG